MGPFLACQATEETMKKRIYRCSALYATVAAYAVAVFLFQKRLSIFRSLYYNIAITGNALADLLWPAGSSYVIMPERFMSLSLIYTRAPIILFFAFSYAVPAFAAGKGPAVVSSTNAVAEMQVRAKDADPEKRAIAAAELGSNKEGRKGDTLKGLLRDKDQKVRVIAAKGLAKDGDAAAYPVLADALVSTTTNTRLHAIEGMGFLKDARAEKALVALLRSDDFDTRWKTVQALGNFSGKTVVDALLAKAADETEDNNIRHSALEALLKIGDKQAVAGLKAINSVKAPEITKLAGRVASRLESSK